MKIEQDILEILDAGRSEGNLYFLPTSQLDRKVYVEVNKVLEALGGKWNRVQKAHVFESPIDDAINNIIIAGEVTSRKKELQFFETPDEVADKLVDLAEIYQGCEIFEPNAGGGAILRAINRFMPTSCLFWCEIDPDLSAKAEKLGLGRKIGDDAFLITSNSYTTRDWNFDRIIINPPFSMNGAGLQTDIDHVAHALTLLKSGGILVSIMSPAIKFRTNRKTNDFRVMLENCRHEIIDLPDGSFKESGTTIKTIILKVWK